MSIRQRMQEAARSYANGGPIRGPGTGTSDSIPDKMRPGTFIMPADSTQSLGAKALSSLGKKVPVNVSNGEYEYTPEQVHAVGLRALSQLKDATHTQAQGADGGDVRGFKPEPQRLYGGGGVLPEEERQRQVFGSRGLDGLRDMIPKMQAMGYEQNPVQVAQSGRVNSPSAQSTDTDQALAALRRARDAQPVGSPNIAAIDQSIAQRNQSIGGAASALSAMAAPFQKPVQTVAPNPTDMRLSANTQATPMEAQAPDDAQRGGAAPAVQVPSLSQQAAQPAPAQPVAQAMAQVPSLAPVQAQGFQAPTVRHSGNDWQARNDLRSARVSASSIMNRPEWQGSGMGRFRGGQQQGPSESTMAYQAALAQDAAAKGQEIAGQQQAMVQGQSNARAAMQQTGENQRTSLREQGFATRDQRKAGMDERTLAMQETESGFKTRAQAQLESLRVTLLDPNATTEQKAQAQAQISALNDGQSGEWGVQVTPATKNVDGSTTAGSIVKYNKRTGETATVGEAGQGAAQAIPQGAVELLKKDPKNAAEFDRKYGAGAAARAMSGK